MYECTLDEMATPNHQEVLAVTVNGLDVTNVCVQACEETGVVEVLHTLPFRLENGVPDPRPVHTKFLNGYILLTDFIIGKVTITYRNATAVPAEAGG